MPSVNGFKNYETFFIAREQRLNMLQHHMLHTDTVEQLERFIRRYFEFSIDLRPNVPTFLGKVDYQEVFNYVKQE